jgi:1,4-dihydroxy-2-naphthoate polyprenyltransferase
MKQAMVVFTLLSLCSGLMLLWTAFGTDGFYLFLLFLGLGLAAIWAAINYTAGNRPYGYAGLGDLAVFLFFGLLGVGGTYFLQTQAVNYHILWPAASLGFFSMAVLNVNNIRDIESDRLAGKYSLPVRLGPTKARVYHLVLLTGGFLCALVFTLFTHYSNWQYLFLLALPLLWYNGWQVWRIRQSSALDPYLKQMALTTLLFVVSFGIGLLL